MRPSGYGPRLAGPRPGVGPVQRRKARPRLWVAAAESPVGPRKRGERGPRGRAHWAAGLRESWAGRERTGRLGRNQGGGNKGNSFFIFKPNSNMNQSNLNRVSNTLFNLIKNKKFW